jgi:hypothetical protein
MPVSVIKRISSPTAASELLVLSPHVSTANKISVIVSSLSETPSSIVYLLEMCMSVYSERYYNDNN